jgi:hypothetical protein
LKFRHILFLFALSVWACSEKPVACFEAQIENVEVFQAVHFQNCSSDSDQYEWDFGDGTISTDVNPVHSFSDTGLFQVQLRAISDYGGNEDLFSQEILIGNPSTKFVGRYQASLEEENYLLRIASGNSSASIILFFDDILFCNATCRLNEIEVDPQNFWNDEFHTILSGVGNLSESHLEINFLVLDNEGSEHLISLTADRINL